MMPLYSPKFGPLSAKSFVRLFPRLTSTLVLLTQPPARQMCYLQQQHLICPPEEFEQTEFYQGYVRPLNLFHALVLTILLEDGLAATIGLARSKEMGIYTNEEAFILEALLPHLQRAFRIGNLLADLTLERDRLSQTLDKLP